MRFPYLSFEFDRQQTTGGSNVLPPSNVLVICLSCTEHFIWKLERARKNVLEGDYLVSKANFLSIPLLFRDIRSCVTYHTLILVSGCLIDS